LDKAKGPIKRWKGLVGPIEMVLPGGAAAGAVVGPVQIMLAAIDAYYRRRKESHGRLLVICNTRLHFS
jgi:hypothetical protein